MVRNNLSHTDSNKQDLAKEGINEYTNRAKGKDKMEDGYRRGRSQTNNYDH